jgi:hypothetical protein
VIAHTNTREAAQGEAWDWREQKTANNTIAISAHTPGRGGRKRDRQGVDLEAEKKRESKKQNQEREREQ